VRFFLPDSALAAAFLVVAPDLAEGADAAEGADLAEGADVAADGVELRSAELSAGGFAGVTPPVCNIGRNSHHANAPSANRERTTITGATREALGSSSSSK